MPILHVSKWQVRVGSLILWPFSGRWVNEATGRRGKMNSLSMRELISREGSEAIPLAISEGRGGALHGSEGYGEDGGITAAQQSLLRLGAAVGVKNGEKAAACVE